MSGSGSNAPRPTAPPAMVAPTALTVTDILQVLQNTGLQIGALTAQVQKLTTNQAAATQIATPRPPDSKKTAQSPTDYDGDIKKGDAWLRELYLYFREKNFTDDKRITIALSYLQGGNATVWRDRKTQELTDWEAAVTNGQNPPPIFQNFSDFINQFKACFCDPDPQGMAQRELARVSMGKETAEQYVNDFRQYQTQSRYNNVRLIELFWYRLPSWLQTRISLLDTPLTTLLQWQEKVIQFDRQRRMDQAIKQDIQSRQGHWQPPRPNPSSTLNQPSPTVNLPPWVNYPVFRQMPPNNVPAQPRPSTTGPMDIDWNKQSSIKCYNCGVAGHITRQCLRTREQVQQVRALVQELNPEQRETLWQELNKTISEQRKHWTTPRGFSKCSAVIAASLSKKLKKHGFGNLKINMHHTCAKNNPYSLLTCHACRLPKTPSNSSFVPMNPNNTIPTKPKTTSEKTKPEKKPQEDSKKTESPQEMRHHQQRRFAGAKTPRDTEY